MNNEFEIETIFSYAEALDQSGRQKNTIHCWENVVYILNNDKTIILRLESSQNLFPNPIGFYASDYDSPNFVVEDGGIVFIQRNKDFERRKKCRLPNITFQEVEDLFYKYFLSDASPFYLTFHKSSLDFINPDLSHIEFVIKNKEINIIQRDIYSGTIIQLSRNPQPEGLGLAEDVDVLPKDMDPLGMRTGDFLSLFYFNERIKILFPNGNLGYFAIEGTHGSLSGIVTGCLFDDIGTIGQLNKSDKGDENGRQEQKNGNDKQEVDRKAVTSQGQILRRRIQ